MNSKVEKYILSAVLLFLAVTVLGGAELDRQWTIYLVQQTHTDIGYTRPQSEILSEHLRYIDYALDFCDLTADYPDEARFRWTCEAAWAVEEYLKQRPEKQIRRLKECIKSQLKNNLVIFMSLFGPYSFFHQSFTSSKLLLQKEICPQKSFINLYQVIF